MEILHVFWTVYGKQTMSESRHDRLKVVYTSLADPCSITEQGLYQRGLRGHTLGKMVQKSGTLVFS
jgi:hypothetical protein